MQIKNEDVFIYFAEKEGKCLPTETGREQFFNKQSKGAKK